MRRLFGLLALGALIVAMANPSAGSSRAAQGTPDGRAQTRQAISTFSALSADKAALDGTDLAELGPDPYRSLIPGRNPTEVVLWRILSDTIQQRSASLRAEGTSLRYREQEPRGTSGPNDTIRRGERIRGFGSGARDDASAVVSGSLVGPPRVPITGASVEDDGAIPLANAVPVQRGDRVRFAGEVGDGPHGATGDFDFYSLGPVSVGEVIVAATDTRGLDNATDTLLILYDSAGNIIDGSDDTGGSLDSAIATPVPADDTYYVMVTGCCGLPLDPFDPASGEGPLTAGAYRVDFSIGAAGGNRGSDADVYLVDLAAGDILGVAAAGAPTTVEIFDTKGGLAMGSQQNVSFAHPNNSPLRNQGFVGLEHIADTSGRYAVKVSGGGGGRYQLQLRAERPGTAQLAGDQTQVLFLDFDGATVDTRPFGGIDNAARLSPLRDFLFRWGLRDRDENAVIDGIIAAFRENIARDLAERGPNGDRDVSGFGGQFDVVIRNSRDHADPGRDPNVTRIVVGGSIPESGVPTIGIAESIDPGNFDRSETALVLLDILSAPRGQGGLNDIRIGPRSSKVELVGVAVGNIAAHEAGHLLGNWHTETFNRRAEIMDAGGDLANLIGQGRDGTFGTRDDMDIDFRPDAFSFDEGFSGREDPRARTAFALSTGLAYVPVTCSITGTAGNDQLRGTRGNDVICGLRGNDVIEGLGGRDRLVGGPGDDILRGGANRDIVLGDAGDDRLSGGGAPDWLIGGPGNDILLGGKGTDRCDAGTRISCERR